MTIKPRILVCSESSRIGSGFGIYNKYLLEGLYKSKKYEVAEFAAYGLIGDKEKHNIPWRYYPNAVLPNDPRNSEYMSAPINQFGKWRLDKVIADYRPHIVIDIRDYWMSSFEGNSAFRRLFHWILMPTIDSYPQQEEWLDTYINADAIFTYSDWGRDILKKQTNNTINFIDTVSPCADDRFFKPNHKLSETKQLLRLDPETTVIGTVMRNQKRKLYYELIQGFEKVLDRLKESGSEKYNKTILYLHTSYPDQGWDMNNLIKNSRVGNRIYFTYMCKNCGSVFASNLSGITRKCISCNNYSAVMPNVSNPVDTETLGKIISIFDMYVQYSICEGFGMPQIEAAYCGVPVLTVNYSAMTDMVNKINAIPIDIGCYFKELETSAIRVYPSEESLVKNIINIIQTPDLIRKKNGFTNLEKVKQNYSWSAVLDKWIGYIDSIDINKYENLWNQPIKKINTIDKSKLPNADSVYEIIYALQKLYLHSLNIKMTDYWLLKNIQYAQNGFSIDRENIKPFSIDNLLDIINQMINNYNISEQFRSNKSLLSKEDFISYGNI
jgi:glycosyltransferase involved in cell wall biosynthesis